MKFMKKTTCLNFKILAVFWLTIACNSMVNAASLPPATAKHGMVVTEQSPASAAGLTILQKGGNAVDAAVAVGYALAVVDPCCGNLGGGGFMLIRFADGRSTFINFRETAPAASRPQLFLDANNQLKPNVTREGYLAVATPGTVAGLNYALQKYGSMPLQQVMQPALNLAKKGFVLQDYDIALLKKDQDILLKQPNVARIFFHNDHLYQSGDVLQQKDLANTLELIASQGSSAFYKGKIADAIADASQKNGGIITKQDLANYQVEEKPPITCQYRNHEIISAPLPSSGGITLCEILNITQAYPLAKLGFHGSQGLHYIIEAMRHAYADRNHYLGDKTSLKKTIDWLLSEQHAQEIRQQILPNQATSSRQIGFTAIPEEGNHTTHYSIVDRYGNAVSVTYTLNDFFGAKVIAGNTGFFLNNEIDDFTIKPDVPNKFQLLQGEQNLIAPNKRPLSSMTPTIIAKNNQLFMVLGAPGGSTIITQVLETMQNMIDYGMNLQEAVNAPRYHMQWMPDQVFMEPFAFSPDTLINLKKMNYQMQLGSPFNTLTWGAVAAVEYNKDKKLFYGAMDARRPDGAALGY